MHQRKLLFLFPFNSTNTFPFLNVFQPTSPLRLTTSLQFSTELLHKCISNLKYKTKNIRNMTFKQMIAVSMISAATALSGVWVYSKYENGGLLNAGKPAANYIFQPAKY